MTGAASSAATQSLIDRYGLSSRIPSRKGKEKEDGEVFGAEQAPVLGGSVSDSAPASPVAGAKWADTKEKREQELKERKARMVLEARK